ncbi:hypothetical protein [Phaeobacter gallaeciensis]|uniref:hypothetical protein n=1 Tax=Phaeobacter gallaeciensis TaxID=60890 RepID=UPI00237F0933|nr:hypothetical protein [Phaeobacter gallaeciensis]MDE4061721.1 hypothetical protein [Phaeobacter gallaeciensis]MDE4124741.1 hypothetical protein [Phaeobacter gallaeciensis]MDE4129213.1 hypothetical protein [Phaeobacter gallaeciensis]
MAKFNKEGKAISGTPAEGFLCNARDQTAFASKEEVYMALRELHMELFAEEYSFMMDSNADLKIRSLNESPLSEDYLNLVNKRRANLGVSQYDGVDSGICDDTWQFCCDKLGL